MKTIQSNSAQKANMRSARKSNKTTTTPSSERQKNEKESSTGKKLVQARLPFKIIAGTLTIKPHDDAGASSVDTKEVPSKKRKLSFTEEPDNPKKIGKSDIKENLTTIDKIDTESSSVEVIVLEDESADEETLPSVSKSPKTPVALGITSQKKKNKATPNNAGSNGSSTTPKLQIKLPLSGKKRRKSKRASQSIPKAEGSDSSDVEILSGEQENPQKKLKVEELPNQAVLNNDDKKTMLSSSEMVDKSKGDINIDKKKNNESSSSSNAPYRNKSLSKENIEEKQSDEPTEPVPQTPKTPTEPDPQTPKTSKPIKSNLKKSETPEVESSKTKKKSPKQQTRSSKSEAPQTLKNSVKITEDNKEVKKNSPEKKPLKATSVKEDDSSPQTEKRETSPKDTSVNDEGTSHKKETRSSRRSIRISETDKNRKEAEEVLSSEPEFVSENTNAADTSLNKVAQENKLLTPKQQKLMEQRKKAREEKELKLQQQKEERERKLQEQREERERKVQEEKIQKQKEREERELLRKKEREEKEEQKRREREEKEDQRRKEKEDKERKRLAEIEAKNEEKRKKDEAKEEERRKKDEDRRRKEVEKEEEENKKKKAAQAFTKFFVPKPAKPITDEDQESRDDAESVDSLAFRPFQVKGDMRLAPLVRRSFKDHSREKLDSFLKSTQTDKSALYIGELKSGVHIPLRGFKTVLKNNYEDDDDDDVVIIASELENAAQTIDEPRTMPIQTYRAKYYYFRENRRPPFYGTWRKKSTVITPRRPFATDKAFFDYEVDSDDEWEEEEPGESLNGSEDEKDESEDEDYEVDNEWFVPHGHLSDEEMQNEDELGPDTSREAQKAKLKALQQEFAQEMKKKTEKIKPRLIGTIWEDENGNRPKLCPTIIWDSLCTRAMIFCDPPLMEAPEVAEPEPSTPPPEKQQRIKINDDLLKDLVRLVHGNRHSRVFLIKEYLEHVSNTCETIKNGECLAPTKSQIKEKIDEISEWSVVDAVNKKNKNKKKLCWVVAADILDKNDLANLGLRNEWSYKLQPKFDKDKNDQNEVKQDEDEIHKPESSDQIKTVKTEKKKPKTPGIAKFTKVITKEEKKKELTDSQCASPKAISKSSPKMSKTSPSPKVREAKNATTPAFKKPTAPATPTATNKTPIVKKRVALLMSVPPGQQFSQQSKNALISKFLQNNKTASVAKSIESEVPTTNSVTKMDVDKVVVLD